MCVCVHVYAFMLWVGVCSYMWRTEVNTKYLYFSPAWFLVQGLSLNLELTDLTRIADQRALRISLSLLPLVFNYMHVLPCPFFTYVIGMPTLMLLVADILLIELSPQPQSYSLVPCTSLPWAFTKLSLCTRSWPGEWRYRRRLRALTLKELTVQ